MSKILEASCISKVVKWEGSPVEAEILSEGNGESEGVLILEKDKAFYLASNATDLKLTLEKIADALTKITETLTAIGAGMTGPTTAPPPSLAVNVASVNLLVTELETLKGNLK
jgi:hypothetical protein